MSRRVKTVVIDDIASRDHGKVFIVTEMSSTEAWLFSQELYRIMGTVSNLEIPDDVVLMGSAGLATIGMPLIAASGREACELMMKEFLKSVQLSIVHEGKEIVRPLVSISADIEEMTTITAIMDKVFYINFGFLKTDSE